MANNQGVKYLIAVTACAVVAYIVYRKFPRQRTSNGTPASTGSAIGGGTNPYYDNYGAPTADNSSLFNSLASLLKGLGASRGSGALPGPGAGGLLPGSNLNAYNVLYNAQHNLNQDGTPINYGDAATTDTLAQSINAQIPLENANGTIDIPGQSLNPISDLSPSTDAAALAIDPTISPESSSSAADAFNSWWDSWTGNPVNQPDASAGNVLDSQDLSSYTSAPDYTNSDFSNVGDYSTSDYSQNYDGSNNNGYTYSDPGGDPGGSYDASNFDSQSYDYQSTDGGGY